MGVSFFLSLLSLFLVSLFKVGWVVDLAYPRRAELFFV